MKALSILVIIIIILSSYLEIRVLFIYLCGLRELGIKS
jgi:hypothetical protein